MIGQAPSGERRQLLIATRSGGKIREISNLLDSLHGFQLRSLEELGIEPVPEEEEIEVYTTFRENAIAKATYFAEMTGIPTIADDSGIAVERLGGAPGVQSKRFADTNEMDSGKIDAANNQLLLERLRGVPQEERRAYFACATAIATPNGMLFTTIGTVMGRIAEEPRGEGGFGYDPIFTPEDLQETFAQLSTAEKNERSHRARAFHALRAQITYLLD